MTVRRRMADDRGAGGMLALTVAAGTLAFSLLALSLFSVMPAKAGANAAADSAAIAAAETASAGSSARACDIAAEAAALNQASLLGCDVVGDEATVTVGRQIFATTFSVTARAAVPRPPQQASDANGAIPLDELVVISYPGVRADPPVYLRPDAAAALVQMLDAYHSQTGDYLPVDEGYRDLAGQQRAFDEYGWPRAAIPGTSNHGQALAVDFVNPPVVRGGAAHAWLVDNAAQFGFEPLTDPDEPWHWDYEG
ncbi:M15 family metallopeptidase [Agreia pratensis]|uniref:Rv3654c family TadE-like protein n=1 Tax=Agreia pratensis TaxID=150121 RepID=UPI001889FC49|nr:Rv3654c family TadE-like protein [Agreia pratensis]MBF4633228.1 M15 family metallopeptidase [Agreia pratensis]